MGLCRDAAVGGVNKLKLSVIVNVAVSRRTTQFKEC